MKINDYESIIPTTVVVVKSIFSETTRFLSKHQGKSETSIQYAASCALTKQSQVVSVVLR